MNYWLKTFLVAIFFALSASGELSAFVASSTNYVLERDSINIAGLRSTSDNYRLEDTVGEVASGRSSSTNFALREAGYQQITLITISAPADVTLTPPISAGAGGQANGETAWRVSTNNPDGYSLSLRASTNPALTSNAAAFDNYTTPTGEADYDWSVQADDNEFGFTPEGPDIHNRYRDDGSTCGSGDNNSLTCWDAITTSNKVVATRASSVAAGVSTSVRFRAEAGSLGNPNTGDYTALITATALTL